MSEHTPEPVVGDAPPKANVLLSNKVFDFLRVLSLYVIPPLAAAYFALSQIWGLPQAEEVVGTAVVLETLLGALLKISSVQYDKTGAKFDGAVNIEPDDEREFSNVGFTIPPKAFMDPSKDKLVLKINRR